MGTPADVFKSLPEDALFQLAEEVLNQEANVLSTAREHQDKAVELIVAATGVSDMRTAERQVVSCTRNEVFARWVATKRSSLALRPGPAANSPAIGEHQAQAARSS